MYCMDAASLRRRDACITRCSGTLNNAATFDNERVSAFVCYGQVDTYTHVGKTSLGKRSKSAICYELRCVVTWKKKSHYSFENNLFSYFYNSWDVSAPVCIYYISRHGSEICTFTFFLGLVWFVEVFETRKWHLAHFLQKIIEKYLDRFIESKNKNLSLWEQRNRIYLRSDGASEIFV